MRISGPSAQVRLLESQIEAGRTREAMSLAVLDKAQEITREQGEAMIRLVEQSGAPARGQGFEALA